MTLAGALQNHNKPTIMASKGLRAESVWVRPRKELVFSLFVRKLTRFSNALTARFPFREERVSKNYFVVKEYPTGVHLRISCIAWDKGSLYILLSSSVHHTYWADDE